MSRATGTRPAAGPRLVTGGTWTNQRQHAEQTVAALDPIVRERETGHMVVARDGTALGGFGGARSSRSSQPTGRGTEVPWRSPPADFCAASIPITTGCRASTGAHRIGHRRVALPGQLAAWSPVSRASHCELVQDLPTISRQFAGARTSRIARLIVVLLGLRHPDQPAAAQLAQPLNLPRPPR